MNAISLSLGEKKWQEQLIGYIPTLSEKDEEVKEKGGSVSRHVTYQLFLPLFISERERNGIVSFKFNSLKNRIK